MQRSRTLRSPSIEPRAVQRSDASSLADPRSSGERPQVVGEHLSELTAVRFTAGRLSDSQRQSVEAHANACELCRGLIARVVDWSNSTRDREAGPEWRGFLLRAGLVLAGRYRIERFVARGGMGEVYEAFDEALGDRMAIKTVASHYAGDSEAIAQLKAEVQLARRIGHRNVCRIYDLEQHRPEAGPPLFFLKMEFIDGPTLGERLKGEHHLSEAEARHIGIGILEGLQAAHETGVLHRDLKSDNVMFRTDRGGRLAPVLMDFGLASALNPNSSRVSGDHALVGSLSYMAPEQVQGDALRPATDLYAVGVILFEMLTGRLPFQAPTPALTAIKRLQEDAPRLRDIDPSMPPDLEHIVARCLARHPTDRYRTAREVLADLNPDVDAPPWERRERDARATEPKSAGESAIDSVPPNQSVDEMNSSARLSAVSTDAGTSRRAAPTHDARRSPWLVWGIGLGACLITFAAIATANQLLERRGGASRVLEPIQESDTPAASAAASSVVDEGAVASKYATPSSRVNARSGADDTRPVRGNVAATDSRRYGQVAGAATQLGTADGTRPVSPASGANRAQEQRQKRATAPRTPGAGSGAKRDTRNGTRGSSSPHHPVSPADTGGSVSSPADRDARRHSRSALCGKALLCPEKTPPAATATGSANRTTSSNASMETSPAK